MGKQTALYQTHVDSDAKIVDFGGWDMPLHYGSQIREHHAVRGDAGMFDVSHMTVVDLLGGGAKPFLQHLLANDVGRLKNPGKALYSCMLNESGGVVDDLIVYYRGEDNYRMVVNAATRDKDMAWITRHGKDFDLQIVERPELAMIAVQGPNARAKTLPLLPDSIRDACAALKPFTSAAGEEWFVGRTGYTGEDGFEIILPPDQAVNLWVRLAAAGVAPCGLGARDTLRLEAGMNLYGSDMDEQTSPLEAGLGWTVAWEPTERVFIGRGPLDALRSSGAEKKLVGLVLRDRGVLRNHQAVLAEGCGEGEITSGGFSPTMEKSIAMARVPACTGETCTVEMRGKHAEAQVVKLPFVRQGKVLIEV